MRLCGEDDPKGMVSDIEGVWSLGGREISRSIRDGICVCVVVLLVVARVEVVGVVRVLCIGLLEVDCAGVVDFLVLGAVFVVEVVEGVELVVGCVVRRVVRLAVWCVNGRGYYLCCFSLKLVKVNGLSVGRFLFWMVI